MTLGVTVAAKRWLWGAAVLVALLGLLTLGRAWLTERRWSGALYCIEQPGTLWDGLAPLPVGYTPECPASSSYRQEVRSGQSRVESYRTEGWRPKILLNILRQAGYAQTTDDPIGPGNYAAFLEGPNGTVQYVASLEGSQTVTTLSGRP